MYGVPGTWNQDPRAQIRNEPGHGVATFWLEVLLPPSQGPETLGIQTPEIDSASRLWALTDAGVVELHETGKVGDRAESTVPIWLSVNDPLPSASSVTLVWQISTISTAVDPPMHPSSGGCGGGPPLDATRFLGSAMAGLLSIIALYQLDIFRRRDQQESLVWLLCGALRFVSCDDPAA